MADAVTRGDADAVRDELGDLLFQVVFQARIGGGAGPVRFRRRRRMRSATSSSAAIRTYSATKRSPTRRSRPAPGSGTRPPSVRRRAERGGVLDGVSAGAAGIDASGEARQARGGCRLRLAGTAGRARQGARGDGRTRAGAVESGDTSQVREELGDLLFSVAQFAQALRDRSRGRSARGGRRNSNGASAAMEARASARGRSLAGLSAAELEALWLTAKRDAR